ncbi:MAG TPA: glycosyltransferase family 4 protein [Chthoniobacteraceae bacterium]|jgi:glycosyltransferase involved in cell wall biosynthesis|nr:glycosyltransferase family 4 protein [Chthoniobacteraceae bacterium]
MSFSGNQLIYIPIPGDHYSATNGSAVMTLVYEFSRKHEEAGGRARIILGRKSVHDYPNGEPVLVDFAPLPTRNQKIADVACGWMGMQRPYINRAYAAAVDAIDPRYDGAILIQNTPGPTLQFKRRSPDARVCLNIHNALFRTYGSGELHRTVDAADLIIFNCDFLANEFRPRLRHGHEKVRVVHNGVDATRFVPRPELTPTDEVVILFVARMVPQKGADLLIRAASRIHGKGRRFKLRIVGRTGFSVHGPLSPYETELRRLAAPMGGDVEFLPFIDRHGILPVYQSASIFCGPSNYDEPCTLAIPEAMACGVPVIASRRGGIPEIGKDAILYFNPPDTNEFAERLAYLIDNANARAEWGRRARAQAEAMDWSVQYRVQRDVLNAAEPASACCA